MPYTDIQKAEAVELYLEHGTAKAAEMTGITPRSIIRWANAAGVSQDKGKQTEQARIVLAGENAMKREQLRAGAIDKALDMLTRMDLPHTDFKVAGSQIHEVEWSTARSGDVKNYAISFAILLDKFRLEMGEATGRMETVDLVQAEATIDQEVARLAKLIDVKAEA